MTFVEMLLIIGGCVLLAGCIGGVAYFVLKGNDKLELAGRRRLDKIIKRAIALSGDETPEPEVEFQFWAWQALVFVTVETTHKFKLPYSRAVFLLNRLFWFNFRWGLWGVGGFYVPFLNILNYLTQRREIKKQMKKFREDKQKC